MPSLVEIAEREAGAGGVVLFDSSVFDLTFLLNPIKNSKEYVKLDKQLLKHADYYVKEFLTFIKKENTSTVQGMLQDFEIFYNKITNKQKSLNQQQERVGPKYSNKGEEQKFLFKNISGNVSEIIELIKPKIFKPTDDSLYGELYKHLPYYPNKSQHSSSLILKSEKHRELLASILYLSINPDKSDLSVTCIINRAFEQQVKKVIKSFRSISISEMKDLTKIGDVTSFSLQPNLIKLYSQNEGEYSQFTY